MPQKFVHKPTVIEAMQFAEGNQAAVDHWLATELGRTKFHMTETHLVIETVHGDSRDVGLGGWVIKRQTRDGFEFYPVEDDVIEDDYDEVDS